MLRDSRDFANTDEYRLFVKALLAQLNAGRRARLAEEIAVLRALPERRTESHKRELVRVDSGSLIHVDRSAYSVPSRLIGARVEARLYMDRIEVWYAQTKVEVLPRLRGRGKLTRGSKSKSFGKYLTTNVLLSYSIHESSRSKRLIERQIQFGLKLYF